MVRISSSTAPGRRRRGPRLAAIAAGSALLAGACIVAFSLGSETSRAALRRNTGATSTMSALRAVALAPIRLVQARVGGGSVLRVAIDIKFKHLNRIHERREQALERGVLTSTDADYVPAEFSVGGVAQRGRLRLTGESAESLRGEQWPMQVQMRGDGHVLGLRRFALRPPASFDLLAEGLFLEELRREDVPAPRILYVEVSINGKRVGVMALEEMPAIEMLERLQRRDGPVLRLLPPPPRGTPVDEAAYTAPLRPLHIQGSRKLRRHHKTAARLMQRYLMGELPAGDVFDVEITGRFLALAELWGALPMLERSRLRFYYNPLTARFEPVASAARLSTPAGASDPVVEQAAFAAALFDDSRLRAAFDAALRRAAAAMGAPSFEVALAGRGRQPLRTLHRDLPLRAPFDPAGLLARASAQADRPASPAPPDSAAPISRSAAATLPLPPTTTAEVTESHPFLRWDAVEREFHAAAGRWDVAGSIILPAGAGLTLAAGSLLRFEAGEGIIARGPLTFAGTAAAPIVLEGPPSPKRSRRWAGVYVIESDRPSRWTHVTVRNTAGFRRNGWFLAGGVVFRKAALELDHCTFSGNLSDDAVNVVRTSFAMRDSTIVDALSDGFDGDYVDGAITGGTIARTGGDAIDVGGSRLRIRSTEISDIRDKAVSVGEQSRVTADSLVIAHVGIAVASKNGSEARLTDSTIDDVTDVALIAYSNRPEYGAGVLDADGNSITRATLVALAQSGSRVTVDGEVVPEVDAAINRLYKEGETDR